MKKTFYIDKESQLYANTAQYTAILIYYSEAMLSLPISKRCSGQCPHQGSSLQ